MNYNLHEKEADGKDEHESTVDEQSRGKPDAAEPTIQY